MELHRTPGWISRVFQSIARWPQNMSLWQQWETIYTDLANPNYQADAREFFYQHRAAMEAGAVVLWPAVEDLYTLMCMRVESGRSAFEREKQNSPINPDLCEWPEAYFDETIWFEAWPANLVVKTMALDPSKGSRLPPQRLSRPWSCWAWIARACSTSRPTWRGGPRPRSWPPAPSGSAVSSPTPSLVEANQFQDLLAGEFEAEFRRQGILAARPVPIENRVPKQVRIRRIGPYLCSRRLRFRHGSPGTRLLVDQLMEFPVGRSRRRPRRPGNGPAPGRRNRPRPLLPRRARRSIAGRLMRLPQYPLLGRQPIPARA